MLHLDIKKLGRFCRPGHRVTGDRTGASEGAGWEFVHLAIDDHSRALGARFQRVLTDNGTCYKFRRFGRLITRLDLRHQRTRPLLPANEAQSRTTGPDGASGMGLRPVLRKLRPARRGLSAVAASLNWHRSHASVGYQAPVSRLNVVGLHSQLRTFSPTLMACND